MFDINRWSASNFSIQYTCYDWVKIFGIALVILIIMSGMGLSFSELCCLFCCPPCPSKIAAKLAFLPPEPTYSFEDEDATGSKQKLVLYDKAEWQYSEREKVKWITIFSVGITLSNPHFWYWYRFCKILIFFEGGNRSILHSDIPWKQDCLHVCTMLPKCQIYNPSFTW